MEFMARRISPDMGRLRNLRVSLYNSRYLQLMILPGLVFFVIFHYVPTYGVIIAFKNFRVTRGFLGSEWVGLYNFSRFLSYPYFFRLFRNTLVLNIYGRAS